MKLRENELHSDLAPALSEATYAVRILGSDHSLDKDVSSFSCVGNRRVDDLST
jgi:hypothetical protein